MDIRTTEIFEKSLSKLYKKDKHLLNTIEELMLELKEDASLGTSLGDGRYKIRATTKVKVQGIGLLPIQK